MTDFENMVLKWCHDRRGAIEASLGLLESGESRMGKDVGSGWVDITDEHIALLKAQIAEIDRLIEKFEKRDG